MPARPPSKWVHTCGLVLGAAGAVGACLLNPQPLPPDNGFDAGSSNLGQDAGPPTVISGGGGGAGGSGGSGGSGGAVGSASPDAGGFVGNDAATVGPSGFDAAADTGRGDARSSDASGDASDATADATPDAEPDGSDAESEATADAETDASSDARNDALDDAQGAAGW
jgi:hypothetical protein